MTAITDENHALQGDGSAFLYGVLALSIVILLVLVFIGRRQWSGRIKVHSSVAPVSVIDVHHPHHQPNKSAPSSKPRGLERVYSFDVPDPLEEFDNEQLLYVSQITMDGTQIQQGDVERGEKTTQLSRSESICTQHSAESHLRESKIGRFATSPAQSARIRAYHHLALAHSSADSDVTTQDCGATVVSLGQGGTCGTLEVAFLYDAPMRKMTVHVLQARDMPQPPSTAPTSQQTQSQIRLLMLPSKKQKHKTKIRTGDNPQFMESFLLHKVNPEDVNSMGVRFRVYLCERMRRQRLIGEAIVQFSTLHLELDNSLWLTLLPKATMQGSGSTCDLTSLGRSDSVSSCSSMQHGGVAELLLGLAYNGTTGCLAVEIIKGSQFRKLSINKAPDTYIKLCVVSSLGKEMARSKTTARRGQPNPLYKELFLFQVALFQLSEVTLMISVWWRRSVKKNEMVGWFSLGLNSSGPLEAAHWKDMMQAHGDQLQRWHVLIDS